MQLTRRAALALALATPAITTARAQGSWRPERPMRVIVPFAPGGATDVVARLAADAASQMLGQNIVIENRAGGAAGLIGAEASAKAAPDGYTIMIHSNAHVIAPSLVARMPYDPIADFAPIAHLGRIPQVLVIKDCISVAGIARLITSTCGMRPKCAIGAKSAIGS